MLCNKIFNKLVEVIEDGSDTKIMNDKKELQEVGLHLNESLMITVDYKNQTINFYDGNMEILGSFERESELIYLLIDVLKKI